jgi:hypothetical protein
LADKVRQAPYVFVGTVAQVRLVHVAGDDVTPLVPAPKLLGPGDFAVLSIQVGEPVKPPRWEAPASVEYWVGGGVIAVEQITRYTLGKPRLFFAAAEPRFGPAAFGPAFALFLAAEADQVEEVRKLVAPGAGP